MTPLALPPPLMTSPRLRSDLLREDALDDEGNTVLRDPVTLHVHRLNAIAAALAARLDGLTPLADVRDAVAVAFQLSLTDAEVLAFYQDLQTRLLLDTDAIRARLVEVAAERQAENVARLGLFEAHFSRLLEYPRRVDPNPRRPALWLPRLRRLLLWPLPRRADPRGRGPRPGA